MVLEYGPLPPFKGPEVWALVLHRVHKGVPVRRPILRDHVGTIRSKAWTRVIRGEGLRGLQRRPPLDFAKYTCRLTSMISCAIAHIPQRKTPVNLVLPMVNPKLSTLSPQPKP